MAKHQLFILLSIVVLLALCTTTVSAAHVTGGGNVEWFFGSVTYAFTAQEKDGEVSGQATFQHRDLKDLGLSVRRHGDITCLTIDGENAWIGGTYTNADDPALVGQSFLFQVSAAQKASAVLRESFLTCEDKPQLYMQDWTQGNVQIKE